MSDVIISRRAAIALALAATGFRAGSARAAEEEYVFQAGRGAFAEFSSRDGDNRTLVTVLLMRSDGEGPDGTLKSPVAVVWTTTWNTKKDKVKRVAFGVADNGKVKINIADDLTSASVEGDIRVEDVVKDENDTLSLDLRWEDKGGKESLEFDEAYSPSPDPAYVAEYAFAGEAREAKADGSVTRGNTELAPKTSEEAWIGDFDGAGALFAWPD